MNLQDLKDILRLLTSARRRLEFWTIAGVLLAGFEVITMGLLLVTMGVIVGNPQTKGGRVDQVMALFPSRSSFLTAALVALLVTAFVKYVAGLWIDRRNQRIVFSVAADLQKTVYRNLLYAPFTFYHRQRHGALTNAVVSIPFRAFQGVVFIPKAILSAATILFMSLFLVVASPSVFVAAAVFAVLYFFAVRRLIERVVFDTNVARHESILRHSEIVSEAMSGIRQIRIFGGEVRTFDEFSYEADRFASNTAKETFFKAIPNATVQFLFIGVLSVVLLGANRTMSPAQFIAIAPLFVTYIYGAMRIMPSMGQLNEAVLSMTGSMPHVRALREWLDIEPDPLRGKGAITVSDLGSGIEFHDVGFWFEEGRWVLRDFDLTIPAGRPKAAGRPSAGRPRRSGHGLGRSFRCRQVYCRRPGAEVHGPARRPSAHRWQGGLVEC